jgi:hypothetical protein
VELAKYHYKKALDLGAPADPQLEALLKKLSECRVLGRFRGAAEITLKPGLEGRGWSSRRYTGNKMRNVVPLFGALLTSMLPAVSLDDFLDNRQAESGAQGFRGEERLKSCFCFSEPCPCPCP